MQQVCQQKRSMKINRFSFSHFKFPSSFEFNEKLLVTIADSLYSCQYGTFLLNSEKLRTEMKVSEYTVSAWTPILKNQAIYKNPFYNEKSDKVLLPSISSRHIKLWKNYYCRYMSGYHSTLVNKWSIFDRLSFCYCFYFNFQDAISQRHLALTKFKSKFVEEIARIRQDGEQQQPARTLTGTFFQTSLNNSPNNISSQPKPMVNQTSATFISWEWEKTILLIICR